ncbi:DUF6318 family protein [Angustibacter sp. Root456]|uniref:DUF6318 family protein n=1 Tax=Angustibacter sp. Root456 TaxID=1736539 RepID=UPI0035118460
MITWGHLRRFVVGACAAVALVACQGSGEAAPTPSPVRPTEVSASGNPSASPTSTSEPSPSAEAEAWARVPKAAREHTFAGAQAFAEFYLEQLNQAWTAPDPQALADLATSRCGTCRQYTEVAVALRANGERYSGRVLTVRSAAWQPESTLARAVVYVNVVQEAATVVDSRGSTVRSERRTLGTSAVEVDWSDSHWRVSRIQQVVFK